MPGYRIHQIERELNRPCHALGGIERRRGQRRRLVVAAYPPVGDEGPTSRPAPAPGGAMSAAYRAGAQTSSGWRRRDGPPARRGREGGMRSSPGPDAALAVMTNREAKLGIVFHEARRVAGTIAAIFEAPRQAARGRGASLTARRASSAPTQDQILRQQHS
jgi:hypothetical protein